MDGRDKESTAMLESSLHIFWCSWCNILKGKTNSKTVSSKVQLQPGVWLQRGMRTQKQTWSSQKKSTWFVSQEEKRVASIAVLLPRALQTWIYSLGFWLVFVLGLGCWVCCRCCGDGGLFCFKSFILQREQLLGEARLAIYVSGNRGKLHVIETKKKGAKNSESFNWTCLKTARQHLASKALCGLQLQPDLPLISQGFGDFTS